MGQNAGIHRHPADIYGELKTLVTTLFHRPFGRELAKQIWCNFVRVLECLLLF